MNIEIIRGDTKKLKFQRKSTTNEVITEKPDKMYFTVKKDYYSKNIIIQKTLDKDIIYKEDDNYYYLTIEPFDTNELNYGNDYVFDIEVITGDNVKTIAKGNFIIEKEVTFAENEV